MTVDRLAEADVPEAERDRLPALFRLIVGRHRAPLDGGQAVAQA